MNEPKKIFLASALAVLLTQASLAWGDLTSETTSKLASNIPAEYQSAISKAFPGYQILSPSEISLDKDAMGPVLYNKVKDSPGLIVGKFNDDNIEDFAALIKSSTIRRSTKVSNIATYEDKVFAQHDIHGAHLVVCYGLGDRKFDCEIITGVFEGVHPPSEYALNNTGPGKYLCHTLRKIDLRKDREPYEFDNDYGEIKNTELTVKTDAISFFISTDPWADSKYIYQSKIAYLECIESSD